MFVPGHENGLPQRLLNKFFVVGTASREISTPEASAIEKQLTSKMRMSKVDKSITIFGQSQLFNYSLSLTLISALVTAKIPFIVLEF